MQPLAIVTAHVAHHVDAAMMIEIARLVIVLPARVLFLEHGLKLDHRHIAALLERLVLIEHVGDAARHAGREVASGTAEHDHHTAGHVFAAVVARAFDDCDGAGVAHREALAGDTAEIALALNCAVQHGIADDDRLLRHDARIARRIDHDAAAREALADIIVGLALELEAHAAREPRPEALAGRAGELYVDGLVGQSGMAVELCDLAGQHGTGGAVGVADRGLDADRSATVD